MANPRQILFRIFYSTSYTIVFFILLVFICAAPADAIYESYSRGVLRDLFLITGAYVLTGLFAILIYASRLYTNRSVLRDIPKTFMPVEKDDLPLKRIYKLIQASLARSAVIAYQAKPRARRIEDEIPNATTRILELTNSKEDQFEPQWGVIEHPGWASPLSKELLGLEYTSVVYELTDLIEAKAVSLAPIDPLATPNTDGTPMPDRRVIEALTRPETAGMRQYLLQLIDLGVIPDTELTTAFLSAYEQARFSGQPLYESDFQSLMRMFAEILRSMTQIDPELLDLSTYDTDEGRSLSSSDKASTFSSAGSVLHARDPNLPPPRVSHDSVRSLSTDEDTRNINLARRSAGSRRFFSTVSRPALRSVTSNSSIPSVRSARSGSSRSNASVIHLTPSIGVDDQPLPYTIQIPER